MSAWSRSPVPWCVRSRGVDSGPGRGFPPRRSPRARQESRTTGDLANAAVHGIFIVDTVDGEAMKTRIQKWGNSLALRIPKSFAAEAQLKEGAPVELSLVDGRLVVSPVREEAVTLEQLLA